MWSVGDVIEDSYANPAVVLELDHQGQPRTVMQTVGSDRGNITSAQRGQWLRRITDQARADRARQTARDEWRHKGLRRSRFTTR